MKTVVLCNRLGRLKGILKRNPGPWRYICLQEAQVGHDVCTFMGQQSEVEELPRDQLFRDRRENFKEKYIELMGKVNVANHSLHWWAMPFTNKYPLSTRLFRDTFNFLLVVDLIRASTLPLLVVTDSGDLAAQLKEWRRTENIRVINEVAAPFGVKRILKQYTPAVLAKSVLRTLLLWMLSRRLRPAPNRTDEHLVIATHTYSGSFPDSNTYKDAYFGVLVDQLASSNQKVVMLGLPYDQPFTQLTKIKRLDFGLPMVPLEACLSLKTILLSAWEGLKGYLRPVRLDGPIEIDGLDVRHLLNQAIRQTMRSGELFLNLRVYHSARALFKTLRVTRYLYPYENRAWEKMILLGARSASNETRTVGYQHTSITLHHTNFMLSHGEATITPLPDAILTCGEVTRDWLAAAGNYPSGLFTAACALRQGQSLQQQAKSKNGSITRILVPLATGQEEYAGTPAFLEEAFANINGFQIRVRPHPSLAFLKPASSPLYSISTGPLSDDLQWADVILYASSTVAMEAVFMGIPAVYLDLGNLLDTDPMFGWNEFKWSVKEPSELIETLRDIDSISRERFQELQDKGRRYVASYLLPVNEINMRPFWEALSEVSDTAHHPEPAPEFDRHISHRDTTIESRIL